MLRSHPGPRRSPLHRVVRGRRPDSLSPSGCLLSLFFTVASRSARCWCGMVLRSAQFLPAKFLEQISLKFLVEHSQLTTDSGPLLGWAVVAEFHPIAIRVMDVHYFADAVVAHAINVIVVVEQ